MNTTAIERRLSLAEQKIRARRVLRRSLATRSAPSAADARSSLLAFAQRVRPGYRLAPHLRLIADRLEAVERGEIDRLLVTCPPRHGKSELASVLFVPWFLGRNPDKRAIAASHTAGLAYTFSRRARNLFGGAGWPFPDVRVASDRGAVDRWDLADRFGGLVAAGVGGPITGHGGDVVVVDDPVKNAEEADSAAHRERVWEWYTSVLYPRLEPGGAIVLIMTRWHRDDLGGRLLAARDQGGDHWEVLHLPALADIDDPLGRDPGAPLWPERFGAPALDRTRVAIGSRAWAALYQGTPTNDETSILKRDWWRRYDRRPDLERVEQFVDTAYKTGAGNDYSVVSTWGVAHNAFYLLGVWRDRVAFPDLKRAVLAQAVAWRPTAICVEDAASGQSLIQELDRETRLPVIPVKVDRDKVARVHAISPLVEAGKVFVPATAPWIDDWIEEHAQFPQGAHDDQVDTTSMALARLAAPAAASWSDLDAAAWADALRV